MVTKDVSHKSISVKKKKKNFPLPQYVRFTTLAPPCGNGCFSKGAGAHWSLELNIHKHVCQGHALVGRPVWAQYCNMIQHGLLIFNQINVQFG